MRKKSELEGEISNTNAVARDITLEHIHIVLSVVKCGTSIFESKQNFGKTRTLKQSRKRFRSNPFL